MMDVAATVISPLKARRLERGFTQLGLSMKAGVSTKSIHAMEVYGFPGSAETRRRLATALECSLDELWPELKG